MITFASSKKGGNQQNEEDVMRRNTIKGAENRNNIHDIRVLYPNLK